MIIIKLIEAEPFKLGMEDGVRNGNKFLSKDMKEFNGSPWIKESIKYPGYRKEFDGYLDDGGIGFMNDNWQPYIGEFYKENSLIYDGDWITHDRTILRKEEVDGMKKYSKLTKTLKKIFQDL